MYLKYAFGEVLLKSKYMVIIMVSFVRGGD